MRGCGGGHAGHIRHSGKIWGSYRVEAAVEAREAQGSRMMINNRSVLNGFINLIQLCAALVY